MAITTINTLPAPVQQWFDKVLLSRPMPNLMYKRFGLKKTLPSREGRTIRFRRYNNLAPAIVPLGPSGVSPAAQSLTAVDIDATIEWYGSYVLITDQVTAVNQDPVLNETASLLAQSMRESEDILTRDMLVATASQVNCVNGGDGDNPTELTRIDIDIVVQTLLSNNAMFISDDIEGSLKFGTAPIREAFWMFMNSSIIDDLENVTGFISQAQYPSYQNILPYEWGSVGNVRVLQSSFGAQTPQTSMLGNTVYHNMIVAREAYGCVDLTEATAEFIYKPLGYGDDPLNQRQTAGYKFAYATRILNDTWTVDLASTSSGA